MATYEMDAHVTRVIPCIWALLDLVPFTDLSTKLGDVKINL